MASKEKIKDVIRKFHANPKDLDAALEAGKATREEKLKKHGAETLNRAEVRKAIEELLIQPQTAGSEARLVEWVGAVAAAAAGAMAA